MTKHTYLPLEDFTNRTAAMSDSEFWKLVDALGWGKDHSYKRIKAYILKNWSKEQVTEFKKVKDKLYDALYKRLFDEVEGVGDDSFSDLLNHIIGLGKREYDANMKDPSRAQKRVNKYDFQESFSYAIPYEDDWKKLERGVAGLNTITIALENWEGGLGSDLYKPVQKELKMIVDALRQLKQTGDAAAFQQDFPKLNEATERIKRFREKAKEDFENKLEAVGHLHWMIQNVSNDLKDLGF